MDRIRNSTKNESKEISSLSPTKWTVFGDALATFIDNYIELMNIWDWSLQATSETEMKTRLQGVKAVMSTFQFLFSCSHDKIILKQADNLSKTLQNPSSILAAQEQEIAYLVIEILRKNSCDEKSELFWSNLTSTI